MEVITKGNIAQQEIVTPKSPVIGKPILDANSPGKPVSPVINKTINWVFPYTSSVLIGKTGNMEKPNASVGFENGIAYSKDTITIKDSAWINFVVTDLTSKFLIGFASPANSGSDRANYKIYINNNEMYILETDADGFYNKKLIGTINTNDQFKITVATNKSLYYKNDKLVYTSKLLSGKRYIYEANISILNSGISKLTGSVGI